MSWIKENDCVGCDYCVNCGRDEDYYIAECDECGNIGDEDKPLLILDGKMLCEDCALEQLIDIGEIVKTEDDLYIYDEEVFKSKGEICDQLYEILEIAEREEW